MSFQGFPQCTSLTLKMLVTIIDALRHSFKQSNHSTVGGNGGCRAGGVRAGTTSPIPDHKCFKLYSNCQRSFHSSSRAWQFKCYGFPVFSFVHEPFNDLSHAVKMWSNFAKYEDLWKIIERPWRVRVCAVEWHLASVLWAFGVMCDHTLFYRFAYHQIMIRHSPHVKWAVSLVIADGLFDIPQGFACMYGLAH